MAADDDALLLIQPALLFDDIFGNRDLTEVMQLGGDRDMLRLFFVKTQPQARAIRCRRSLSEKPSTVFFPNTGKSA